MRNLAYIFAIAMLSNNVFAADTATLPTEQPSVQTEKAGVKTGVRKPIGDVNKFWDNIDWNDMSEDEKQLWSVLSDGASWDKLSKEERAAASALGFDRKSWNSVPASK